MAVCWSKYSQFPPPRCGQWVHLDIIHFSLYSLFPVFCIIVIDARFMTVVSDIFVTFPVIQLLFCTRSNWSFFSGQTWILKMYCFTAGAWGSVVVKALRYQSDGPGIDSRWCHWGSFPWYPRQNRVPWGQLSLWKWVPGISPGVKVASAFGWLPTTLVVPKRQEIRGLKLPGTPWLTSACRGRPLLLLYCFTARRSRCCPFLKRTYLKRTAFHMVLHVRQWTLQHTKCTALLKLLLCAVWKRSTRL